MPVTTVGQPPCAPILIVNVSVVPDSDAWILQPLVTSLRISDPVPFTNVPLCVSWRDNVPDSNESVDGPDQVPVRFSAGGEGSDVESPTRTRLNPLMGTAPLQVVAVGAMPTLSAMSPFACRTIFALLTVNVTGQRPDRFAVKLAELAGPGNVLLRS